MSKPLFVAISDIHFNLNNLEVASEALRAAISKAEQLEVPLVIAGDLNDTKAIIRAEVANRLIEILDDKCCPTYLLVGNHDLINEKGLDHGLNYLNDIVYVIDKPQMIIQSFEPKFDVWFIPYQSDSEKLKVHLMGVPEGSLLVMHQGFLGAAMGEYIQDRSSIDPNEVKDFTVITGHYHKHQTIGTVTYIGSPYTTSFAEANDGPKGFLVVYDDHSFEHVPTNLRKHISIGTTFEELGQIQPISGQDFLRLKVSGTKEQLDSINKDALYKQLGSPAVFKFDKIYSEIPKLEQEDKKLPVADLFDRLIDNVAQNEAGYLKQLWREVNESRSN